MDKPAMSGDMLQFQRNRLLRSGILFVFWSAGVLFIWLSMFSPWGRYRLLWDPALTALSCLIAGIFGLFVCGVVTRGDISGVITAIKPEVIWTTRGMSRTVKHMYRITFTLDDNGRLYRFTLKLDRGDEKCETAFENMRDYYRPGDRAVLYSRLPYPLVISGKPRGSALCPMCASHTYLSANDTKADTRHVVCDGCGGEFPWENYPSEFYKNFK